MHHRLRLCRSSIEDCSSLPNNLVDIAVVMLWSEHESSSKIENKWVVWIDATHQRFFHQGSEATIGHTATHAMMLFDGDRKPVQRAYGLVQRIQISSSLQCLCRKKFGDTIDLKLDLDVSKLVGCMYKAGNPYQVLRQRRSPQKGLCHGHARKLFAVDQHQQLLGVEGRDSKLLF